MITYWLIIGCFALWLHLFLRQATVAASLLDRGWHAVLSRPPSSSVLSTEVSSLSLGLDMFRNFIQTVIGILSKICYGHNHKYPLNHKQSFHAYVHTAPDGDLKL